MEEENEILKEIETSEKTLEYCNFNISKNVFLSEEQIKKLNECKKNVKKN